MNNLQWPHFSISRINIKDYSFFRLKRKQIEYCVRLLNDNTILLFKTINASFSIKEY